MIAIDNEPKAAPPEKQDDPPNASELDKLQVKLARHNKGAEQLAAAMGQKPKKA